VYFGACFAALPYEQLMLLERGANCVPLNFNFFLFEIKFIFIFLVHFNMLILKIIFKK
jgi:hypothetical protein